MGYEDEMLEAAAQRGQWGFSFDMRNVGASPSGLIVSNSLLTVDLPDSMAQTWTLNLLAPRYQGTGAITTANQQPPENAVSLPGMYCRVDYGIGAAMEQVEFDYQARGNTVQFHASVLRVYLNLPSTFGQLGPLLGGFLAPKNRGNTAADWLPSCTWTAPRISFTFPGPPAVFVWAPRRARGYRLVPLDLTAAGTTINVTQVRFDQTNIAEDYNGTFPTSDATQRETYAPLLQGAVGIRMTAAPAAGTVEYTVQWLLDIG